MFSGKETAMRKPVIRRLLCLLWSYMTGKALFFWRMIRPKGVFLTGAVAWRALGVFLQNNMVLG